MRWTLGLLATALVLSGCNSPAPEKENASTPPAQGTSTPGSEPAHAPLPVNMETVGKWQGEAGDVRLTLDLKDSGDMEWKEETADGAKTWTGRWRDEGGALYLMLQSPTKRSAYFEKKDNAWVEVTIDDKQALKGAEIVLKRL